MGAGTSLGVVCAHGYDTPWEKVFRDSHEAHTVIQYRMRKSSELTADKIEEIVFGQLGRERIKSVESRRVENDNAVPIIRIKIVYSTEHGLSVDEMGQVLDAIWPEDASDTAPFPVIDFQEDTDIERVPAE